MKTNLIFLSIKFKTAQKRQILFPSVFSVCSSCAQMLFFLCGFRSLSDYTFIIALCCVYAILFAKKYRVLAAKSRRPNSRIFLFHSGKSLTQNDAGQMLS